jgi:hypothetical protein
MDYLSNVAPGQETNFPNNQLGDNAKESSAANWTGFIRRS